MAEMSEKNRFSDMNPCLEHIQRWFAPGLSRILVALAEKDDIPPYIERP
jgi:hypothetical protein